MLALIPFGLVFGVTASEAGLTLLQSIGYSLLVFTGSAQFAAVEVLGDGGTVAAAVLSGLLLNLRSLAFGVVMAPAMVGSRLRRAAESQLMIDESVAVATAQTDLRWRHYGYLAGGLAVFAMWNVTTIVGFSVVSSAGDVVEDWGLDVAGPAAFLALLWPRLARRDQQATALVGAAIALTLVPITPAGVPIIAGALGVVAGRVPRERVRGSTR